jgi:diamine N-acetyltransferase
MTPRTLEHLRVRRATTADAGLLASLAATTFVETFRADNSVEDMAAYVAETFGEDIQRRELDDPRNVVLLAEREGVGVGYAMLRDGDVPDCVPHDGAIEISRLYATARAIGSGVGRTLMAACLAEAATLGKRTIWLGVWERNARAIAFYERWSFRDVGAHGFQLGSDRQTDRVMCRAVEDPR